MKVLFLFGDAAVGKMTVGQELMKITEMRLCHNHVTIEPVIEVFGKYDSRIIERLREVIYEEYAKSDNYGIIFTYMWAFDMQEDWNYIEHVKSLFEPYGAEFYYVELVAPLDVRLERNVTENRILHKASKRNLADSNKRLLSANKSHRFESYDGEITFENYIKIDNTSLSAHDAAKIIKDKFDL